MTEKTRLPTPQEAQKPNAVDPKNVAHTMSETGEMISYDSSKPVFMVSRLRAGKVVIPSYEEIPKVTGRFKNIEHPGQPITIPFRKGWKGPIRYFTLEENRTLTIPVTLCDTLNDGCAYVEKKWVSPDGSASSRPVMDMRGGFIPSHLQKEVKNKRSRFQFIVDHKVHYSPKIQEAVNA
jgi:hypothetical protein